MIENWKTDMVKEINRIAHDTSTSSTVREEGIRLVYQWYRLARHVSMSQLHALESTKVIVEMCLTGVTVPSSHEQDEAANQVHIPDCHCRKCGMAHVHRTQLVGLARSFLDHPSTANKPPGHESRLIAVAEACMANGLPNDIILMVLALVEAIEMFRCHFIEPGEKRWLSAEDVARMDAGMVARAA
ncbi:MAG: hypothetical protein ALECFALPRED_009456 [Alectoria fallacina]|uniref:Uncharacterized protein n=1 Tax=Alectoria fallacina TaxID=1903189 RepID=A0A8H3J7P2_9LECA|nr:MAG: hypothetical protein ALECFALPRED_009456 [Alectoria fallacina]